MKAKAEARADSFEQFGLSEPLLKAIADVGYEAPSPIQLKTIPLLLEGRDVVGVKPNAPRERCTPQAVGRHELFRVMCTQPGGW